MHECGEEPLLSFHESSLLIKFVASLDNYSYVIKLEGYNLFP